EEDTACRDAGVEFIELLIGYDVLAVVGNPEDDFLTCLTADNLNVLLSPSATVTNWDELGFGATAPPAEGEAESTEEPTMLPDVTVLLPEDTTLAFENLNELVTGFGFRADANSADVATILDTVSTTSGAIGFVPLADALSAGEAVSIVDLNLVGSCVSPSVETVENESYPAGTAFYLYVATSAQENLAFLLDYLTQAAYTTALNEAGYTGISDDALSLNTAIITGDVSARAATAEEITFIIPQGLTGNVNVAGALSGFTIGDGVANRLISNQQSLVVNTNFAGETAGIEAFCNGDVDIVFVEGTGDLCDGAVETVSYDFGTQAVVLVANPADSFANCLTLEQINTIWATSTDPITSWSGIGEGFPEQDIVLVGVNSGNLLTGILMNSVSEGIALPVRVDVAETNASSSYRASAVGNVSGGLSYMSWIDYQSVVEAGESNVQLVAVNSGNGCVVPSEASIIDGSYTISRSLQMIVKQSSLARIEVQSFVWSVFDDTNANVIAASDFIGGFQSQQIISFRSDLLAQFEIAEQAALEASAEVTPEVTPEMTEEASGE
ncbi:MAG: substrate-binding domain-containing protein, partial [Chloroflexota bacterium]